MDSEYISDIPVKNAAEKNGASFYGMSLPAVESRTKLCRKAVKV